MTLSINTLGGAALMALALAAVSTASAQEKPVAQTDASAPAVAAPAPAQRLRVGDATRDLLAKQSGGTLASSTPRPIPGETAHRSYQRYLNSFDHPIPEKYSTTVKSDNK